MTTNTDQWRSLRRPIVRVRGLSHWFGVDENRKQVLESINLDIWPGEMVIMTGPSGSGKTTLLTLIGGLRSLQEGELEVNGQLLAGMTGSQRNDLRTNIGFIFQAHNLFESLTALQNVRMALELHPLTPDEIHDRATTMLTALGLESRIHYKPAALSGGQRQRVAIARALVSRPRLILADEPTAALDKQRGRDVVELLQKMARDERCAIILVTHDSRILDVADRIVSMVDGRITSNFGVEESVAAATSLSSCPIFTQQSPAVLREVLQHMRHEAIPAGQFIFRQGDPADKLYLIERGEVEILMDDGNGEAILGQLHAGEYFGERALLANAPRHVSVRAKSDVELLALEQAEFNAALAAGGSFRQQMLDSMFRS